MGRKKIEIQPITHERNRSVTFLKRKNGLFKKAYELGVLCSVDVAVIIFEERPGHHLKLYQYCSADINDIVQRHIRHDGEKDHKGPADFSGNNNPKLDDIGDDNDDDGDEDDEVPSRNKRGRDGKLKPPPDMHVGGMDYGHRSLAIPQAPSLSMGIGPQNSGPGLPISSDRLSNLRHTAKRGRIEINPQSRSPSDDPSNAASYYQQSSATPFAAARQTSGYHHPSHHQGNPQYTPFFSPQTNPSFIQSGGAGHSSRAGPGYGLSHHSGASSSAYDSAPVYPNIMGRTGSTAMTSSTSAGSSGGGLFPPFLDTDEQGRHQQHPQAQQTGFGSLEWPVHSSGNSGSSGAHSSLPESVSNPQPPTDSGGQNSNSHWLDFLSSNNSASSASNAREIMSWERGGGPPSSNSDLYGERSRPGTAGSPLIAGILNTGKRSPGGLLTSPLTGVNGRDDNKDSIQPG